MVPRIAGYLCWNGGTSSSELLVPSYWTTQTYIPKDCSLAQHVFSFIFAFPVTAFWQALGSTSSLESPTREWFWVLRELNRSLTRNSGRSWGTCRQYVGISEIWKWNLVLRFSFLCYNLINCSVCMWETHQQVHHKQRKWIMHLLVSYCHQTAVIRGWLLTEE